MLLGRAGTSPAGTGYLVRPNLVLTARHVVVRSNKATIRYDAPIWKAGIVGDGHQIARVGATVVWRGTGRCDIALLHLDRPVELDVVSPEPAGEGLRDPTRWHSRGWAVTSPKRPLVRNSLVSPGGGASAFLPDQERVELTVKPILRKAEWWKGISGAPVFETAGRRRILGVIVEADPRYLDQLEACPIAGAMVDSEFMARIGWGAEDEGLARLLERLREVFREADALALDAISARKVTWGTARGRGANALFDALVAEADPIEVVRRLNSAHKAIWDTPRILRKVADQIECIALCYAPLAIDRKMGLPQGDSRGRRTLPAATKTLVELQAARIEGKPSRLKLRENDYPDGVPRLEEPCEVGLDSSGSEMLTKFGDGLRDSFLFQTDVKRIEQVRKESGNAKALEELFARANGRFEHDRQSGDFGRRRYLSVEAEFAAKRPKFLEDVRTLLSSVYLFEETSGDLDWEQSLCLPLKEILQRSTGTRKKR